MRPEESGAEIPPYLAQVASHTGNLVRLEVNTRRISSFRTIALTNPNVRCVVTTNEALDPLSNIYKKWIARLVEDFLTCCDNIEDIVIIGMWSFGTRISAVEEVLSCLRIPRKVSVRIGHVLYDIGESHY